MGRYDFYGYRRENGRVGIRNHVIILPLDDLSNAACEAVANNIKGTLALPHAYGRLQFGEDLELHFRTLIGTGAEPERGGLRRDRHRTRWTGRVVEGIAKTGKPVAGFSIEGNGDIGTIAAASRKAREFVQWASEKQRELCTIQELFVSTKCGESDTTSGLASCPTVGNLIDKLDPLGATTCFGETSELTGAEVVCASRAASKEVADEFMRGLQRLPGSHRAPQDQRPLRVAADQGQHRRRPHHHRGKGVRQSSEDRPQDQIHRRAEARRSARQGPRPVLHGYVVGRRRVRHAAGRRRLRCAPVPTGQGNVIGNPIEPVIKLTANPKTARTMVEHIDLDVSGILRREMTLDQAGDRLIDIMIRTCNGRLTCAEALGHREFVMTKLYQSA